MNPFRLDVLGLAIILGIPLIGLGLNGDASVDQLALKALACIGAATVAIWAVRAVARPAPSESDNS
ncbi:hypothetical protein [Tessaracoccus sp.]